MRSNPLLRSTVPSLRDCFVPVKLFVTNRFSFHCNGGASEKNVTSICRFTYTITTEKFSKVNSVINRFTGIFFSALLILFCFASCNSKTNGQDHSQIADTIPQKQLVDVTVPGSFSTQEQLKFDSAAIPAFIKRYPSFLVFQKDIQKFYRHRRYSYAWFDENGIIEQAGNLYNKIENIRDEGLEVKKLYPTDFHNMMDADSAESLTQKANTELELMLTAQYFFYAKNIWTGLGEKAMKALNWDLPRKKLSYESLLDSLLEVPSSEFMKNEPVYRQYGFLKTYLKKYRGIQQAGGWPVIKADKKSYKKGDSSAVIKAIRKRLALSGDLATDNQSILFDEELETAVKLFQHRYGLKEDGVAGKNLLREMNYPVEKKIEQIIVNMERCRWLPVAFNKDYLVVNIPEFRFHAFENDRPVWSMKVVVGKSIHETAIFTGTMKYVVFSPYWNVPPGIMKNEILPAVRRNKNYLERNHMEWNGNSVRQVPGPWNALGKVKFLFPNSHNIYLHDTPAKDLFNLDQRAFSHGCIRVEEPKRLAMYVLRHQPEWTEEKIDSALNASKEQYVTLKHPVQVLIAYFTAWVDAKGNLNFRNDLYKRDARLAKMILENSKL
jgi:L,D-transpeptidase YcbB